MIKYKDIMEHFGICKVTAWSWVKMFVPEYKIHRNKTLHPLRCNVTFDDDVIELLEKAVERA